MQVARRSAGTVGIYPKQARISGSQNSLVSSRLGLIPGSGRAGGHQWLAAGWRPRPLACGPSRPAASCSSWASGSGPRPCPPRAGALDARLVIGRRRGAPLLRPLRRGERSEELWSVGAAMAGFWTGAAALATAGRRGRRWPQPLMRSVALWTVKVRSDGTPLGPRASLGCLPRTA